MHDEYPKDRKAELDSFWDISELVPEKMKKKQAPAVSFDVSTCEIELDAVKKVERDGDTRATEPSFCAEENIPLRRADAPPRAKNTGDSITEVPPAQKQSYCPEHPLIEQVTIHAWKNDFPYYERFRQTAQDLFCVVGEKCEAVSFFSYMPQYDQMNRSQLAWYLYWRDLVRRGEFPKTDHSYIFLFLFEIINLPDKVLPEQGLPLLCRIWLHYREDYPILDRYLSEWICDYCLLYRLSPPVDLLGSAVQTVFADCRLREFYVAGAAQNSATDAAVYLGCCSNYDYKKSRAYSSDRHIAAAFDAHIPAALERVLHSLTLGDRLFSQLGMQSSSMIRDTFVGAICSRRVKYKIEVSYRSFSRSHELRFLITDVVKYSENKLRAIYGYKSRLSVNALPDAPKEVLNGYFAEAFPRSGKGERAAVSRPEYEHLYDLPNTPMSSAAAARIELDSWQTTQRLVEAFGQEVETERALSAEIVAEDTCPQQTPDDAKALPVESCFSEGQLAFLKTALMGEMSMQIKTCRTLGDMPEVLADAINEIATDTMGDIVLEERDGGFYVIDDYRSWVEALFS